MNHYIFLTFEWSTNEPNDENIENGQILWMTQGNSKQKAFQNLKKENEWLLKTSFDEVYCYELKDDKFTYFYLKKN